MSKGASRIAKCLVSAFVFLLAVSVAGRAAESAVGDVIQRVNIPTAAQCSQGVESSSSGSAVAIVQGSKVGFPEFPILLVITCVQTVPPRQVQLRFLDPGTRGEDTGSTATLIKTINVSLPVDPLPPNFGFQALALRADTGDLLACGTNDAGDTLLYAIDISIFNTTLDGTATFLLNGPSTSTCEGVAWDVSDKMIFHTSSGLNILHFPATGTSSLASIASGCPSTSFVEGLALAGPSLFVGCLSGSVDTPSKIRQINKATGAQVTELTGTAVANINLADFECDAASFGKSFKDVLWAKDSFYDEINAIQIPAGTCSLSGSTPLVGSPGACPVHPVTHATYPTNPDGSPLDTDGDGLPDCWEDGSVWAAGSLYVLNPPDPAGQGKPGIDFDGDGVRDIVLCVETNSQAGFQATECADKNVKDIFVEFDSMQLHPPDRTQLTNVVTAFANAPVANPAPGQPGPGGSGPTGIRLHIQIDDQNIPHTTAGLNNNTAMPPCTPVAAAPDANFDDLKKAWFGTLAERGLAEPQRSRTLGAKKLAFRYGIGVHNLTRDPATGPSPSGCSEVPGNDFIVALGSFGSGIHRNGVGTQEYWGGTFMHELGHTLGLRHGGGDNNNCKPNYLSIMSYPRQFKTVLTDRPLNYSTVELPGPGIPLNEASLNAAQGIGLGAVPAGAKTVYGPSTAKIASPATGAINWGGTAVDINQIGTVTGCDGGGTTLFGYNDWANLVYNFRATVDFADGAVSSREEIKEVTEPQVQALAALTDADRDGTPDNNACGGVLCLIDIVPGVASNKVFLFDNHGVATAIVPVAVLSTSVFDATMLDPHTLRFAGTPVATRLGKLLCARLDVNRDQRPDLVCTFVLTGLSPGEQTAVLEGVTLGVGGVAIRAEGTMLVVKAPPKDDD